ncbi:MAG TPA: lytic transglycosylase domain-containing protein [Thermoanaerobaculia bacterium]|nr:lytic transglycosylase domain-containing protein [Thermoanaerobaculia bacterium]
MARARGRHRLLLAPLLGLAVACGGATPRPEPTAPPPVEESAPAAGEAPPAAAATPTAEPAVADPRVAALAERAAQGDERASASLLALSAGEAGAAAQEQAALALGALLVEEERQQQALPLLRRAALGIVAPDYARLLFARAVAEGALEGVLAEARDLLLPVLERADTPALARQARLHALHLATRAGDWPEAAEHGRELLALGPPARQLDEARWLTAESLRLAGRDDEALGLYRTIWLETPGSRWALEARDRLVAAGAETEPPAVALLLWIEQLQRYGLHREALAALAPLLEPTAEPARRTQARFLAARSHLALRQNAEVVAQASFLRQESPQSAWAGRAAVEAMRALGREEKTSAIREGEAWLRAAHPGAEATHEARYYLGSYLGGIAGGEAEALEVLREVADGSGPRAADALWRVAWLERRLGRTAAARELLERLRRHPQAGGYLPAALYWLGRFADPPGGDRARELYRTVVREAPRDYYGVMAGDRLRELGEAPPGPAEPAMPLAVDPLSDPQRRPEPAYRRAVALRQLGLPHLAASELETLPLEHDPPLQLALAHLYARGGDTWTAIGTMLDVPGERLRPLSPAAPDVPRAVWETLYPFPYRQSVAAAAARHAPAGLPFDRWLVAALARRESRFWPRATSPAGAVGLLQLMPETARAVAGALGAPPPQRGDLFDPALNLELGTAHLASLVAAFDGEWAPALAAYNAGETAARRWWRQRPPGQALDEWIETIPYPETRLYVKAILGAHPLYRQLYPDADG